MNRLSGTLVECEAKGAVARITIVLAASKITAVVIGGLPSISAKGSKVAVCFKESETALAAADFSGKMSIRNRLPCTVISIEDDGILCRVNLNFESTSLAALITSESARDLGLSEGSRVLALVKSTEVMIAENDA
jgi:molybdate transport system regulatory protein